MSSTILWPETDEKPQIYLLYIQGCTKTDYLMFPGSSRHYRWLATCRCLLRRLTYWLKPGFHVKRYPVCKPQQIYRTIEFVPTWPSSVIYPLHTVQPASSQLSSPYWMTTVCCVHTARVTTRQCSIFFAVRVSPSCRHHAPPQTYACGLFWSHRGCHLPSTQLVMREHDVPVAGLLEGRGHFSQGIMVPLAVTVSSLGKRYCVSSANSSHYRDVVLNEGFAAGHLDADWQ